jgi:hypothetical protein
MSESESDALSSAGIPADAELERGLRNAVAKIFKTGNPAELTVKRVRLATEQALGLEEGFFKGDADWKARSDTIIKDEAVWIPIAPATPIYRVITTVNANATRSRL